MYFPFRTLNLQLNSRVLNTRKPVSIRTGDELYGRIINVFGDPVDNMEALKGTDFKVIRRPPRPELYDLKSKFTTKPQFLETGINTWISCSSLQGSKMGILGGAGCGKSVVILELINNIVKKHDGVCILRGSESAFVKERSFSRVEGQQSSAQGKTGVRADERATGRSLRVRKYRDHIG